MADGNPPAPNPYVFGYGSLIWNPGFPFIRSERALLHGAHRSLSVYSHRHRGTAERPGLVFGLSRGGACAGIAFEVEAAKWPAVFDYLQEREQDRGVYREVFREVTLQSGTRVRALAYLVNQTHPQFAGRLSIPEQVALVRSATGESGRNTEYVRNTARHLLALGIRDRTLEGIVAALDGDAALLGGECLRSGGGEAGNRLGAFEVPNNRHAGEFVAGGIDQECPVGRLERQAETRAALRIVDHIMGRADPHRHGAARQHVEAGGSEGEGVEAFRRQRVKTPRPAAPVDLPHGSLNRKPTFRQHHHPVPHSPEPKGTKLEQTRDKCQRNSSPNARCMGCFGLIVNIWYAGD